MDHIDLRRYCVSKATIDANETFLLRLQYKRNKTDQDEAILEIRDYRSDTENYLWAHFEADSTNYYKGTPGNTKGE